jgi:hypothetical protein
MALVSWGSLPRCIGSSLELCFFSAPALVVCTGVGTVQGQIQTRPEKLTLLLIPANTNGYIQQKKEDTTNASTRCHMKKSAQHILTIRDIEAVMT